MTGNIKHHIQIHNGVTFLRIVFFEVLDRILRSGIGSLAPNGCSTATSHFGYYSRLWKHPRLKTKTYHIGYYSRLWKPPLKAKTFSNTKGLLITLIGSQPWGPKWPTWASLTPARLVAQAWTIVWEEIIWYPSKICLFFFTMEKKAVNFTLQGKSFQLFEALLQLNFLEFNCMKSALNSSF